MGTGALALDEPTSQLDPVSAMQILGLLAELNQSGMAIVLSEHRLEKAMELATRCLVLDSGRVIFDGPAEELEGRFPEFFRLQRPCTCGRGSRARKIVVEDLAFAYPRSSERALDGVSMVVNESEILGILAENGGGKSTLSEILTGLISPYSGRIEVDGTALSSISSSQLSRLIGIVFQDPNIHLFHETVREEIEFAPRNMDLLDPARIDWVIELFGLGELQQRNPRDLSGGQKEKVAIASVVSYLPEVLILDEPTRGLDTLEKAGVMEGICELRRLKGTTVIIPTHDLQLLNTYADRVVVLRGGRTVFEGAPSEAAECFVEGLCCPG
jgi:energy-coupling factor transporter ATP-binding protein EcfA2